jgi:hypothetical protein
MAPSPHEFFLVSPVRFDFTYYRLFLHSSFPFKWIQFNLSNYLSFFEFPISCRGYVIFNSIDYSVGKDKGKRRKFLVWLKCWLVVGCGCRCRCQCQSIAGRNKKSHVASSATTRQNNAPPLPPLKWQTRTSSIWFLSHLKMSINTINFSCSYVHLQFFFGIHFHISSNSTPEKESNQMQQPPRK